MLTLPAGAGTKEKLKVVRFVKYTSLAQLKKDTINFIKNNMGKNWLGSNTAIFLLKFNFNTEKFVCQGSGLMDVIKEKGSEKGIEYIKRFDPGKCTFKRVSRSSILNHFSWNTEMFLFLQSHSFFTGVKL